MYLFSNDRPPCAMYVCSRSQEDRCCRGLLQAGPWPHQDQRLPDRAGQARDPALQGLRADAPDRQPALLQRGHPCSREGRWIHLADLWYVFLLCLVIVAPLHIAAWFRLRFSPNSSCASAHREPFAERTITTFGWLCSARPLFLVWLCSARPLFLVWLCSARSLFPRPLARALSLSLSLSPPQPSVRLSPRPSWPTTRSVCTPGGGVCFFFFLFLLLCLPLMSEYKV
jgi:hypothetical protein